MTPIHPEDAVLKEDETMRMMQQQIVAEYLRARVTIVIARLDVVQVGVSEIHTLPHQVERQSVRPVEFSGHDGRAICAVHVGAFDSRHFAPVCPEDEAGFGTRVHGERTWITDVFEWREYMYDMIILCFNCVYYRRW